MPEAQKPTTTLFDPKPLAGQHALITGGSRGIGWASAHALARLGARVSLTARDGRRLEGAAAELRKAHSVDAFAAAGDMASPGDIARCFNAAADAQGPIDILVNNAGVGKSAPFHRMDLEFWRATLDLNLTGPFLCCQQVYSAMRARGYGRIITIASTVGLRGYPYIAAYAASKHGVIGLTRTLALEAAKTGITVNAVCPGYTDTDLVSEAVDNIAQKTGRSAEEARADLANMSPMGRMITPEEVAETVAWLALPSSASITGQAIVVAGGTVTN